MATQFELQGIDELRAKLQEVSTDMQLKGGRLALRRAAQLVRNSARRGAQGLNDPQTGRAIADNIVERWNGRLFKRTGDLGFRVGVSQGAVLPAKGEAVSTVSGAMTPHWRLLEFGTEKMAARPFMRPALESNAETAAAEFVSQYQKALDRAIKRAKK